MGRGEERCRQGSDGESWLKRKHLEDLCIDGKMILKWIFEKWFGSMDWIDLTQDRDRWRVLVNAVVNLRFRKTRGLSWPAENLLAS